MLVRVAAPDDARLIAEILAAVAPEGSIGTEPPVDVAARTTMLRETIADPESAVAWILEDDGEPVGFLSLRQRTRGVRTVAMAILPRGRGRGGGRQLLQQAISYGESSEAHKLDLEVWPDNGRAIGLYASAGFAVEGLRRDHYRRRDGRLRSSLIMARRLDAEPDD